MVVLRLALLVWVEMLSPCLDCLRMSALWLTGHLVRRLYVVRGKSQTLPLLAATASKLLNPASPNPNLVGCCPQQREKHTIANDAVRISKPASEELQVVRVRNGLSLKEMTTSGILYTNTCVGVNMNVYVELELSWVSQKAQDPSTSIEEGLMTWRSTSLLHICSVA